MDGNREKEICGSRREENYQEYLRLKDSPDYTEVIFDEQSGGVSAVHKEHCFDKQVGPFGQKRGDYERHVIDVLRVYGHCVVLQPETNNRTVSEKHFDALLDYDSTEIKTIEGVGHWAVRTKLQDTIKQGADVVVLYFPKRQLYSESRVVEGWRMSNSLTDSNPDIKPIRRIFVVVEDLLAEIAKPPG